MNHRTSCAIVRIGCLVTVAVGLIAASASLDATDWPWLTLFDALDWPIDGNPAGFDGEGRVLNAVLGGLMVGWGVLMLAIVSGPFRKGDYSLAAP